ncbi:protein ABHD11-like [Stegodyphus dumicola]|uniref:protein ABHD11-like n=1 Tax=Stegodyphus dumicola TaxID=202533 RepID=UPI0015AB7E75|nr:protein ABHD11-like [Stegodyphus dumicola]
MTNYTPVRLAYKTVEPVSGAEDKAPIIFLHGLTASTDYWFDSPRIIANETKRKIYLLDARNHGDSEWSDEFDFDMNSNDLMHFMDTMNIPKAVLLGHSMGGITAMSTALKKKERVEMIIVEDMSVRKVPKAMLDIITTSITLAQEAAEKMLTDVDENGAKKFIFEYILDHLPAEAKGLLKRRSSDEHKALSLKRNPDGRYTFSANIKVLKNAVQNAETLMSEPTGVYEGPACFIYGKDSPFHVGADELYIRQFFPNAEFVAIEKAAHSVHMDCPSEFIDAVLKFLSQS